MICIGRFSWKLFNIIVQKSEMYGISPEDQEAIFERFKKLDDFVQGTGLGLSICQAIVKQLNGRILLKSEKNKGCRISLVFEL